MTSQSWLTWLSLALSLLALVISLVRNRWMAKQLRLNSAISIINWLEDVRPDLRDSSALE